MHYINNICISLDCFDLYFIDLNQNQTWTEIEIDYFIYHKLIIS